MQQAPSLSRRLRALCLLALMPASAVAMPSPGDLTSLELEQLMAMEVSGITGRVGSYVQSPAAVWVISSEDIHRSGYRSIADILRMAPGLQVARRNAQDYTVTSRGFSGDKLQVLVDGRSVYSPLQSQVFWDVLDTYLEDIARIEVIRGPGATIWGANAVNGVINIVTKPAADSAGVHLHGGGGSEERAFGGFRAGGKVNGWGHGRLYAQARERDSSAFPDGTDYTDGLRQVQAGGRLDGSLGSLGALTITGDIYSAHNNFALLPMPGDATTEGTAEGRNFGLRWAAGHRDGGETVSSFYYDGYDRLLPGVYEESRDTFDLSVQQNFAASGRHRVTAGLGTRTTHDRTGPQVLLFFDPESVTRSTYSAFVQDEIGLGDWSLVLGTKLEHNDFTGLEWQPGVRLGWSPTPSLYSWAAVSLATRTPNRLESDIQFTCTGNPLIDSQVDPLGQCSGPGDTVPLGNPDQESEQLVAYEWGIRSQFNDRLFGDLALFFNDYRELSSLGSEGRFTNDLEAESYGGELTLSWEPVSRLTIQPFYGFLKIDARRSGPNGTSRSVAALEGGSPQQRVGLRVNWQPLSSVTVSNFVRYVDRLEATDVPDYVAWNLRLGWHASPLMEFALNGQNLGDRSHAESGSNTAASQRAEIERAVFGEFTWRWQ